MTFINILRRKYDRNETATINKFEFSQSQLDIHNFNGTKEDEKNNTCKKLRQDQLNNLSSNSPLCFFRKIRLNNLSNGKTTIKNASQHLNYYYDAMYVEENPVVNKFNCSSNGNYSIELDISDEFKTIYMPDLAFFKKPSIYENHDCLTIDESFYDIDDEKSVVSLSGKINIEVFQKLKKPIIIDSIDVFFKCFISEFINYNSLEKKDIRSNYVSFNKFEKHLNFDMLPVQLIKINLLENIKDKLIICDKGKILLPFTILINSNEFPNELNSIWGKTCYRIECQIFQRFSYKNNLKMILLTESIKYNRVFSNRYDLMMFKETIFYNGDWKNSTIYYQIGIDSKIIEINSKFDITIELLIKDKVKINIKSISIFLIQITTIPNKINVNRKNKSFEIFEKLYKKKVEQDGEDKKFFEYKLNSLKIRNFNEISKCRNLIQPFHFEKSILNNSKARIKISHSISIRIKMAILKNDSKTDMTSLYFKIPICLVDSTMLSRMTLPAYE